MASWAHCPSQVLSTRARKDVSVGDIKVQVVLFAFDCLYLNGESLLDKPLTARREALYGALMEKEGELQFATTKISRDVEDLEVRPQWRGRLLRTPSATLSGLSLATHSMEMKGLS